MSGPQTLTVPGRYDAVRLLCEFIATGARDAGLDDNTVFHLELCCDEASTNIIEHAYGAESVGDITASYAHDSDEFVVTLTDSGRPFDLEAVTPPVLPDEVSASNSDAQVEQIQVGGLGLHFIRELMDRVTYSYDPQEGNKLVMVKQTGPREAL